MRLSSRYQWVSRSDRYLFQIKTFQKQIELPPYSLSPLPLNGDRQNEAIGMRWKEPGSLNHHMENVGEARNTHLVLIHE